MHLHDPDSILEKLGLPRSEMRKMEYDDEIYTALETRLNAILSMPWRLEPSTGNVAEFIHDEIETKLELIIRGVFQAVKYGYSVLEIVYSKGSRIGLDSVIIKPFEWFTPKQRRAPIFSSRRWLLRGLRR